ncbi:MAG: DUF87 domain-containing protein [Lentisphaeria bacterium]|nr:DUF87 domain-containing protein [Lentisphaeria bacterium]
MTDKGMKEIKKCQCDIEKMLKKMEGYSKKFAKAAERLRSLNGTGINSENKTVIDENAEKIQMVLDDFSIDAQVDLAVRGPRVTRYEIKLGPGVEIEEITDMQDMIAMHLHTACVRMVAPIPGRAKIGIEVPNKNPETVMLNEVFDSKQWLNTSAAIPLAIGKNAVGEPVILDLDRAPHILLAGATGTGKSTSVNSMIVSMIKKFTPDELQFIMFDPQIVELDIFRDLPHLRMPIVKDTESFVEILRDAAIEIDNRYNILADYGVKNISEYNAGKNEKMPRLVIVIDELYELMKCEDKTDVENVICRIAQKGRAAGVHLLIATEFPRSITGIIKANIPGRLCFQVRSLIESRIVCDEPGAEKLLGQGDMLMQYGLFTERVQGAWISNDEIKKIIEEIG